jgi:hypothetical protein
MALKRPIVLRRLEQNSILDGTVENVEDQLTCGVS